MVKRRRHEQAFRMAKHMDRYIFYIGGRTYCPPKWSLVFDLLNSEMVLEMEFADWKETKKTFRFDFSDALF